MYDPFALPDPLLDAISFSNYKPSWNAVAHSPNKGDKRKICNSPSNTNPRQGPVVP